MEYGHIVITNTKKGWVQAAIRYFTGSKFSHSLFTIPQVVGKQMGVEAAAVGVEALCFDTHYRFNPNVAYKIFRFRADPAKKDVAIGRALESLQDGYGYLELPWFIWRWLNAKFGRDIRKQNNWYEGGKICSEITAQYICDAGYPHLFAGFGKGAINAQDVLEVCEAHPELFELVEFKE
jgi:hypothetical protein